MANSTRVKLALKINLVNNQNSHYKFKIYSPRAVDTKNKKRLMCAAFINEAMCINKIFYIILTIINFCIFIYNIHGIIKRISIFSN
ncbi:hypothetical protein BFL38_12245 [Brachyspira hampsonii]|uniref:Uncharacterized protein n=1 Tax=Brachyspira hampsonii TaxID=1287055 RepID=A0A1E5NJC1_9SPIR|nr:hypothetical protein BFL38_12245 [Brachyspira hampsonii]